MQYLFVRHKVKDFSEWKKVFNEHHEAQLQSGLRIEKVLRNIDDANEVFLWFEVMDLDKARGFVSSAQVPDAQQQSGVVDKPDIYFVE